MLFSNRSVRIRLGLATVALCLAAPAIASAQDCYRPAECDGQDICIGNVCVPSEEPLTTCDDGNPCESAHAVCDVGYCKLNAVYCENPAGHGFEENEWGIYSCETGECSDWEAEEPPVETLTDQELFNRCQENLVSFCGEDAPDITDECTPEQLDICEDYYNSLNQLLVACDEAPEDVDFAHLKSCCNDLENGYEYFQDQLDCVMALALEDCADLEDCFDDGDNTGGSDSDSDADGEADTGGTDSGGCRLAPVAERSSSLLDLLLRAL